MEVPVALIYIHGFISSPQSTKAQLLLEAMKALGRADEYYVPQLAFDPERAITLLEAQIQSLLQQVDASRIGLVGSSLGGYYASWLANKYNLKAVLVNPSVRPYDSLKAYLGEVSNIYTGEKYTFEPHHIEILKAYDVSEPVSADNFYLLVQTADEVLDYRQAVEKFSASRCDIQQGGNHGFENFEKMIPSIFQFLDIRTKR